MPQEILVNITPREVRIALLEGGLLQEVHIERSLQQGLLGNIYKGRVSRLLPGIQAAFIDIGLEKSAFLHTSDMGIPNSDTLAHIDIRDYLAVGQQILVQVYKDPLGSKGARLTTQFTVPSRYLVLTPGVPQISVSQKIVDTAERERLLALLQQEGEDGFIFRTAAVGVAAADIAADKAFLTQVWAQVMERSRSAKRLALVYEEIPLVLRVLRDLVGYNLEKIRVDNKDVMEKMQAYAKQYLPALVEHIEFYAAAEPIFDNAGVEDEIQKALERKVYLKSGGHIVFDQTEAMTTIDVNTGSYLGNTKVEETIVRTNLEAVTVIARQIRLRNLGGIIIIDFIDMVELSQQEQLIKALTTALANDSARTQISELSSLGLVQLTRKRTRESLEHVLCVQCPMCQQRGSIKSLPTVCYEIFRDLKRVAGVQPWPGFLIVAAPSVAAMLENEEADMWVACAKQVAKPIEVRAQATYGQEQFDILPLETQR